MKTLAVVLSPALLFLAAHFSPFVSPANHRPFVSALVAQDPEPKPAPVLDLFIKFPANPRGEPGEFVTVKGETNGSVIEWASPDRGLNVFPASMLKDSRTAVVNSSKPGAYRLWAWTARGNTPTAKFECIVTIGVPAPTPTPTPDPPTPDPKPKPPEPAPTPAPIPVAGLRVLMVFDKHSKTPVTKEQLAVMDGQRFRDFLNTKCVMSQDGKTKDWKIWAADTPMDLATPLWRDAMARKRTSHPWMLISNGVTGWEGPLPATIEEAMSLVSKYERNIP